PSASAAALQDRPPGCDSKTAPSGGSGPLDAVSVVRGQQEDLVASAAEDDVEEVQHIPAEDAQLRGGRVGEGGEVAPNVDRHAVVPGELKRRADLDEPEDAANPAQAQPGGWGERGESEPTQEIRAQDGAVG